MHPHILRRLALLTCMMLAMAAQAKDFAIVVHKANDTRALSLAEFQKLLRAGAWPGGKPATMVVTAREVDDVRRALHKLGAAPDERAFDTHFLVVESDDAVLDAVARTPGAIGVVDVYSINGNVTVLKIEGKLPLEAGYVLHR